MHATDSQITVKVNGKLFTALQKGLDANKPYLWPNKGCPASPLGWTPREPDLLADISQPVCFNYEVVATSIFAGSKQQAKNIESAESPHPCIPSEASPAA